MRTQLPFAVLAAAFACSLATTPANARARVFVASYGNDENPCTFGSPCKTFQQAVNVVDAGGEVTAIDSAGFGPITIGKSVTITSPPGVEAGIVPTMPGSAAIFIFNTASTDTIVLRGLTLQGSGSGQGILVESGGNVEIVDCAVRGFMENGITISNDQSAQMSVVILNTLVADTTIGIAIGAGSGSIRVAMDGVKLNNQDAGIELQAQNGFNLEASIANSRIDNARTVGLLMAGSAPTLAAAFLRNVTITQTPTGINLNGSSVIYLSQVQQQAFIGFTNTAGINFLGTGNVAISDGTNHIQSGIVGGSLTSWAFQ
jgi:hypothetical protein